MLKDFKISRWFENFEIYKDLHNLVPRAFPSKNGWGATHFLREKPWGRGCDLHGEPLNCDWDGRSSFYKCDWDGRSSFFHSNPSTFRQPLQELLLRYGAENLQVK